MVNSFKFLSYSLVLIKGLFNESRVRLMKISMISTAGRLLCEKDQLHMQLSFSWFVFGN